MPGDAAPVGEIFDVAVIGAGVVGCAATRRLTLDGARVVVLEKAADPLDGASKGNSGLLHTGFDAPVGSLEARLVAEGRREYLAIRDRLGLPLMETGAMVLAWSDAEAERLDGLIAEASANDVCDLERLSVGAIRAREPALGEGVVAGFLVPGESVIDPWSAPLAYLQQAVENGATLLRGAEILCGAFDGGEWRLETAAGPVRARAVVNAAGLWGDVVEARLLGDARFAVRPRKGQFVVFDKAAAPLVRSILLPVPTEKTKGVVLCPTIWGNVIVGPTAEDQDSRDDASTDGAALEALRTRAAEMVPALADMPVTATYAGLRPATERKEYRVHAEAERRYLALGGIRSTGLSAALGLARHAAEIVAGWSSGWAPVEPSWPRAPQLAESGDRDWRAAGNGGIVCLCELVTRREIEAALSGPLAARTLSGLKRRTRATMGRCQGFHCLGEIAEMSAGRLDPPLAERGRGG